MVIVAVGLFVVAALSGVFMAAKHFKQVEIPYAASVVHGLGAAGGAVLLALAYFQGQLSGLGTIALVLFVGAALGGAFLFVSHIRGKNRPTPALIVHALVAVVAFLLLVVSLLGPSSSPSPY